MKTLIEEFQQKETVSVADFGVVNPLPVKTSIFLEEAVKFLNSIGYMCRKSTIYQKTAKNELPFSKFKRRMVFNPEELRKWVILQKTKTVDVNGNVFENTKKIGGIR